MEQYRIYTYNSDIEQLIRIAMFTYITSMDNISISDDYFDNEELHTNLFNPTLWSLEVKLLVAELSRNTDETADEILQSLQYAFSQTTINNLEEIEQFKANYYKYLGYLTIKDTKC